MERNAANVAEICFSAIIASLRTSYRFSWVKSAARDTPGLMKSCNLNPCTSVQVIREFADGLTERQCPGWVYHRICGSFFSIH
jgi:hypothetical protein